MQKGLRGINTLEPTFSCNADEAWQGCNPLSRDEDRALRPSNKSRSTGNGPRPHTPVSLLRPTRTGGAGGSVPPEGPARSQTGELLYADSEADIPSTEVSGAICVQRFDDSRNSAIHTTYRTSLRSSSLREPRHPLLGVFLGYVRKPCRRCRCGVRLC